MMVWLMRNMWREKWRWSRWAQIFLLVILKSWKDSLGDKDEEEEEKEEEEGEEEEEVEGKEQDTNWEDDMWHGTMKEGALESCPF